MTDLRRRFQDANELKAPDLWSEAHRRSRSWVEPSGPKVRRRPADLGRRVVTIGLAFAVFAAAAAFAWRALAPGHRTKPASPTPTADLTPIQPDRIALSALPAGWSELPAAPPDVRSHAAVGLDGARLLVWGGDVYSGFSNEVALGDGYVFDLEAGDLEPMASSPLAPRLSPASAWTGSEFVVWGGDARTDGRGPALTDGAAYDPNSDTWRSLPPAPVKVRSPRSAWTGSELLIWSSAENGPGIAYEPSSDTWRTIAAPPVALSEIDEPLWTGSFVVAFAPQGGGQPVGIEYDPREDAWRQLAPSALWVVDATWVRDRVVAWGYDRRAATYDPATNVWRDLPRVPAGECEGGPDGLVTAGRAAFGRFCGHFFALDTGSNSWHDVTPTLPISTTLPVPSGDSVLLPSYGATYGPGEPTQLLAYRPPGSFVCGGFEGQEGATLARSIADRVAFLMEQPIDEVRLDLDTVISLRGAVALDPLPFGRVFGHEVRVVDDLGDGGYRAIVTLYLQAGGVLSEEFLIRPSKNLWADTCSLVLDDASPLELATRFAPDYTREGDRAYATLTFPNGSRADVSFPVTLRPFVQGVEPHAAWVWRDDPSARHPISFLHGPLEAASLLTQGPVLERLPSAGEVDAALLAGRDGDWWLAFELPNWTVLVWVPNQEGAADLARSFAVEEDPYGFPVIRASGPAALAQGFGEGEGPELSMQDPSFSSDGLLELSPEGCSTEPEVSPTGKYGSTCLGQGSVFVNVSGSPGWVRGVLAGLVVERFIPA
jgi:hypothetical protein